MSAVYQQSSLFGSCFFLLKEKKGQGYLSYAILLKRNGLANLKLQKVRIEWRFKEIVFSSWWVSLFSLFSWGSFLDMMMCRPSPVDNDVPMITCSSLTH